MCVCAGIWLEAEGKARGARVEGEGAREGGEGGDEGRVQKRQANDRIWKANRKAELLFCQGYGLLYGYCLRLQQVTPHFIESGFLISCLSFSHFLFLLLLDVKGNGRSLVGFVSMHSHEWRLRYWKEKWTLLGLAS